MPWQSPYSACKPKQGLQIMTQNTIAQVFSNAAGIKDKEQFGHIWQVLVDELESELPRGSGFDSGSKFLWDESTREKLIFTTDFHHMNEGGFYDGWTQHRITVTPCFYGFNIKVSGSNRGDIREYISDCFHTILSEKVETRMEQGELTFTYCKEIEAKAAMERVTLHYKAWGESPANWLSGQSSDLALLVQSGYAEKLQSGWIIPTRRFVGKGV
jgi:hypothetical protein